MNADIGYPGKIHCLRDKTSNLTIVVPREVDGDNLSSSLKSTIAKEDRFVGANFIFHYSCEHEFIDVLGQVDKGIGVEVVTRFLGGCTAETFAIGGALNDLPILQAVNYPICPANAVLEVQNLCTTKGHLSDASYIAAVTTWLLQIKS